MTRALDLQALRNERGWQIGIALCISDEERLQFHLGIAYKVDGDAAKVLHLGWHAWLKNDELDQLRDHNVWFSLEVPAERIPAIVMLCERVWARRERIPYGVLYDGGAFQKDGILDLGNAGAVGLTCATFVLALLRQGMGLDLLNFRSWPKRPEDAAWHAHIVAELQRTKTFFQISDEHITAVRNESGCARFRPEEVAAATAYPSPVQFEQARDEGRRIVSSFIWARALQGALTSL